MTGTTFDYVLVGSGVAATTIAGKLLQANPSASIVMLEAGPVIAPMNRRAWWDYVLNDRTPYSKTYDVEGTESFSIGKTAWGFRESRVRAVGGSTMHWGGWSLRYKPEDFALRTNTGEGADWPITYDDLERWYCDAEDLLSVCGDESEGWTPRSRPYPVEPYWWTEADGEMIQGFEANGIKPGKMPVARYRKCMTTGTCKYCPIGARYSAQNVLSELLAAYPNLKLVHDAPATRIVMDGKRRAVAVEYRPKGSDDVRRAEAGAVVVCAGAYETPKLLLASTSADWPAGIGNDQDLVGRHLVSHSMLLVRGTKPSNPERWLQQYDFPTLMSRSWDVPDNQGDGKVFLFPNRTLPNVDIATMMSAGASREQIERAITGPRQVELQGFLEEKGEFNNRVTLGPIAGPFGLPSTTIDFTRRPRTTQIAAGYMDRMAKVLASMGYVTLPPTLQTARGDHSTGTCRMSAAPDGGVTDPELRVHDTDNLYLCSNAVMPTSAAVNPTLTLTALALRLGDHLSAAELS